MTAKEYLARIQIYRSQLDTITLRMEELYTEAEGVKAIVYDKDKVQVSPENRFEAAMIRLEAEAEKWARARKRYEEEARKRIGMIERLDNNAHVRVLTLRYIEGKRWEEIAEELHYSFRHVTRLHGEALTAFSRKYKDVLLCPKL